MTPLRLDEKRFEELPDKDQHAVMFESIERLITKVEELCGAKRSFKNIAIKWGAISGGFVSVILILVHDPDSIVGKIAASIVKAWLGN